MNGSAKQNGGKAEFRHIILGIIASIFLYISSVELLTTVVDKQSIRVRILVYASMLTASILALWWLSRRSPRALPKSDIEQDNANEE